MKIEYASDQVNGTIVNLINSVRQEALDRALSAISKKLNNELTKQDMNFAKALAQVDHVQQLVNSPEKILGRMNTKHGELAEQVEVAIQNSKSLLRGAGFCATADPDIVGRTVNAPTDYIINGVKVQSKFINGETNTLSHVINHLDKYKNIGFGRDSGSYYHIPKDQYENIIKALEKGEIDGRRLSSTESIISKVKEIEELTGRKFTDVVKPAHVKYGEVQWGRIDGTLEKIRFDIKEENADIIEDIKKDSEQKRKATIESHQPSLNEAAKVGGISAAVSGGISLIASVYAKTKDGKRIEEFTEEDWKEIGLKTVDSSLRGGVSGLSIYGLTNCLGMPAPLAAGTASAILGISELVVKYNKHEITGKQLMEEGQLLCLNSAAATLGSTVGQQLIPIPVIGAVLGSMAGTYCAQIVNSLMREEDSASILSKYGYKDSRSILMEYMQPMTEKYGQLLNIIDISFDINSNYALRLWASQRIALESGVPEREILNNVKEINSYFLT